MVTILASELIDNLVPIVLKLFAIVALGHEKVDNNKLIRALGIQQLLQLSWSTGLGPQRLLPPVLAHCQDDVSFIFLIIYYYENEVII